MSEGPEDPMADGVAVAQRMLAIDEGRVRAMTPDDRAQWFAGVLSTIVGTACHLLGPDAMEVLAESLQVATAETLEVTKQ